MKPLVAACLLYLPICGLANPNLKEWQKRYDGLSAAIRSRSISKIGTYVSNDFVWVDLDGKKHDRAATLAEFAKMFKSDKVTGGETISAAVQKGDRVEVAFSMRLVLSNAGKKDEPANDQGIDTWKKVKGRWVIVKSVSQPAKS